MGASIGPQRQKRPLTRIRPEELRSGGETIRLDVPQRDDGSYEITAEHLKTEALTFVYRLALLLLRRGAWGRARDPADR